MVVAFVVEVFCLSLNVCDYFNEGLRTSVWELSVQLELQGIHLRRVNFGKELASG